MGGAPHDTTYGTTGYGPSNSFVGSAVDSSLDHVALFDLGYPGFYSAMEPASNAPFVYDPKTGKQVAHWPTGVEGVAAQIFPQRSAEIVVILVEQRLEPFQLPLAPRCRASAAGQEVFSLSADKSGVIKRSHGGVLSAE